MHDSVGKKIQLTINYAPIKLNGTTMLKKILAIFIVIFVGYLLALLYRYEPIAGSQTNLGTISVWDRWHNKVCVVSIAQNNNKPMCSIEELAKPNSN